MAEIDLTPTEEMAANAARGLELRRKHGKGGTEIGVARARDISNRKNLSPETVRRMHAFFSRHEKNKAGGEDDAGYIAWLLWGGDSGQSWAKRKVEQMNKGENERSDTYKEIAQRLGSAAKFASIDAGMMDGAGNEVVIRMADGSRATARYNRGTGKWSLEGHADIPAFAKVRDLVAHLTKQGMARPGDKSKMQKEYVLWGIPKGKTSALDEQVLSTQAKTPAQMDAIKKRAAADGWHSFRVQILDLSKPYKGFGFSRPGAKAKMGRGQVISVVQQFLAGVPAGATKDALQKALIDYADNSAAERRMQAEGNKADARRFNHEVGRANEVAVASWLRLGGSAKMADLRQVLQTLGTMPFSRPGAKAKMGRAEQVMRDGSVHLDFTAAKEWLSAAKDAELRYIVADSKSALNANPDGKKFNYYRDLVLEAMKELKKRGFSRPGAKAKFGYEKSINIMLEDARIPDHVYDWRNGVLLVDAAYHDRIVAVLKSYVPWEIKSLPKIQKVEMSRPGAKAKFGLLTSVSTLPNTGSVNNTAKRFLERLQRVNLNDYEGFESFHRNLSEAIAGVVRNTNKSLKNHEYGEWTGKDLAAILQREMGRSAALTRTAEAWLGVSMMSRPGAKAKMGAHWTERVEVVEDVSFRNKNTGATVSGGGAVPWRSSADRANWEAITHYSLMDTRTGTTAGKQYRTRQEAERALADAKAQRIRDERRAEREASSPDARRRAATIKEIDRLMATGMTQIEAIQYLKSRGLRIASSRPGAKVANAVREGEKVSAADDAVSRKIRKLMDEGKPQKQAVAIALDLERRGEL